MKDALRASHDLKPTERLVLVAIVAHANADGAAWPSVQTVAEYVGCSERTVQRALRRLVEVGRLLVQKVAGIATRVYRLVVGGGDIPARGGDFSPRGGDTLPDTQRSVEDQSEDVKRRAPRVDWRRLIPKSKNPTPPPRPYPYPYPERRGAALPPPVGTERCPRHIGQTAAHCAPCRSERLGGGR
ncbi:helix-turn-helix domain-containing protein [Micromonospora sp. NPDC004551]|uniref:helix-turn-helix domain-containing protein n=1 Tax=Micromonospora sp. NPDC004551 TaxID=3154284 RepID=UPI0033B9F352